MVASGARGSIAFAGLGCTGLGEGLGARLDSCIEAQT